ncbi:acetyltransferase [Tateyamaria omphalii]|uniref:GNAT family N-acetyltransferase n=1 Tax=Tateyamaria omphalii TaxID=299262 RepID=UPI00167A2D6C|nr:GNAT family N-acetyltransferase [Tateyamaria omphalii]GGX55078.1 acetyltransferase [Tateyamaria omphalii]
MKNMEIRIRAYQSATDLKKLSNIWFDASSLAHAFVGHERLLEQRYLIETQYLPNAETWVAIQDEVPVGFISLLDTFVGGLFVAPHCQGTGIGRRLITHALDLKGALSLEVYTENVQALDFYNALGFKELSRRAVDDDGLPFENAQMELKR